MDCCSIRSKTVVQMVVESLLFSDFSVLVVTIFTSTFND